MSEPTRNYIMGASLSFDVGIAKSCGINAAVVYNHILYWLRQNIRNPRCWHDERIWMYESLSKMSEFFDFLSEKEVRNAINILTEKNLIEKSNFNNNKFDRTCWYTVSDQSFIEYVKKEITKRPVGQMEETGGSHPKGPVVSSIYKEEIRIRNKKNINIATGAKAPLSANAEEPPLSPSPKKSIKEQPKQVEQEVWVTPTQEDNLLKRLNGDTTKLKQCYLALSAWKIGKGISGGTGDYKAITGWVISSLDQPPKANTPELSVQNKEYAKTFISLYRKPLSASLDFLTDRIRIETARGNYSDVKEAYYKDAGFKSQLEAMVRHFGFSKIEAK